MNNGFKSDPFNLSKTFGLGMLFFIVWILTDQRNHQQLYAQTCKHHHVLEVGADLVSTAQVQQEGERIDVRRSAQKHSQLGREVSRHDCKNWTTAALKAPPPLQNRDILSFLRPSEGSVHEKVVLGYWFLRNTMSCNSLDISLNNNSLPLPWWD